MSVRRGLVGLVVLMLSIPALAADEATVYATVDGEAVTVMEVDSELYSRFRQRFFHGRADEAEVAALRKEVGQALIDQRLLEAEARKRNFKLGVAEVEGGVEARMQRLAQHGVAREQVEALRQEVEREVTRDLLIERLKQQIETVSQPDGKVLVEYYKDNLDKFTTPERLRLSVILLKVAPSAPISAWNAAQEEAGQLLERLARGANFAELAVIHSSDNSAENGGDLGFVHQGMLSAEAQKAVDGLKPGQVSPVVVMLQGVALFRLEAREAARVNEYEKVSARVRALWEREERQRRWGALLVQLRDNARIVVNE